MANKAHVAKTYRIEYGTDHFNHAQEAVNRLLYGYCGTFSYSGEYAEFAEHIEVGRDDLSDLIERIEEEPKIAEAVLAHCQIDNIYSFKDVIGYFRQWIEESDPSNSFIVVDWF